MSLSWASGCSWRGQTANDPHPHHRLPGWRLLDCCGCVVGRTVGLEAGGEVRGAVRLTIEGPPRTNDERFWDRVDKAGPVPAARPDLGPCWIWTGAINRRHGYGRLTRRRVPGPSTWRAHVYAYLLSIGPVAVGLVLDHLCRVRSCVNPAHLEPVTQAVNCQRGMTGKAPGTTGERNKLKTRCPQGHEYAGENLTVRNGRRHCRACERERSRTYELTRKPRCY